MYLHEPNYDLDSLARQNLHVHTEFSHCAKAEMTVENILAAAEAAGLQTIALTDHFNSDNSNGEFLAHIRALRLQAEKANSKIVLLIGGELSAYAPGMSLESEEVRQALDYRMYSCNHFHLDFWGQPESKTPRGYAAYSIAILHALIEAGKADCIAHPMIGRFVKTFDDKTWITKEITDNELGSLFELSVKSGTAWEINTGAILGDQDFGRRLWNIGRETGVVFNYGTDAHLLSNIDTARLLPDIKKALQ